MDKLITPQRKNFRCVFNRYVTKENRDGIIQSIIAQFQGYDADPEITVHDDGFILTLTVDSDLTPTSVRDKILWNQFVDSVTTQDAIRKIQIIRLPKSSGLMDFGSRIPGQGSVGGFGPAVDPITGDTGVDEKLNTPLTHVPKYQIDADPNDTLGHHASVRRADKTDFNSEGQAFVQGLTPADLDSEANVVDSGPTNELDSGKQHKKLPSVFGSFKRIAIDSDTGSAFTLNKPNGFQSVNDTPRDGGLHQKATPATGIGGGAPISGASWYVTQPGNEQGTELGAERNKNYDLSSSSAPLGGITANKVLSEEESEDTSHEIKDEYGSTLDALGVGEHPMGGASYGSFGLNEYYDYIGDIDDYDSYGF